MPKAPSLRAAGGPGEIAFGLWPVVGVYPLASAGVLPDDMFAKSFGAEGKALLISDKPFGELDRAAAGAGEK